VQRYDDLSYIWYPIFRKNIYYNSAIEEKWQQKTLLEYFNKEKYVNL